MEAVFRHRDRFRRIGARVEADNGDGTYGVLFCSGRRDAAFPGRWLRRALGVGELVREEVVDGQDKIWERGFRNQSRVGRIVSVNGDGSLLARTADGKHAVFGGSAGSTRTVRRTARGTVHWGFEPFSQVEVEVRRGRQYQAGCITEVHEDDRYAVEFENGERATHIPRSKMAGTWRPRRREAQSTVFCPPQEKLLHTVVLMDVIKISNSLSNLPVKFPVKVTFSEFFGS